ncbi:hypothetical protein HPB52_002879 [Rhipicephalus sanguineus]|uniref:Uncharacterized protein n=1 Tax=Rhipicephalus sanguineus TaxID=34632 RepID=A0A9D4T6N4_RHISA|nr:hypothetical protein HPB52_002879 [Rhipicephalus sanguineus]
MDVCPEPQEKICRGCYAKNPHPNQQFKPKCRLCGGEHLMAHKSSRAKLMTPYIVKKRRWERKRAEAEAELEAAKKHGGEITPHPAKAMAQIQRPGQVQSDYGNRGLSIPPAEPVEERSPESHAESGHRQVEIQSTFTKAPTGTRPSPKSCLVDGTSKDLEEMK